jgi:hypothetical protein
LDYAPARCGSHPEPRRFDSLQFSFQELGVRFDHRDVVTLVLVEIEDRIATLWDD